MSQIPVTEWYTLELNGKTMEIDTRNENGYIVITRRNSFCFPLNFATDQL